MNDLPVHYFNLEDFGGEPGDDEYYPCGDARTDDTRSTSYSHEVSCPGCLSAAGLAPPPMPAPAVIATGAGQQLSPAAINTSLPKPSPAGGTGAPGVWTCKIGCLHALALPAGADEIMRQAVELAFRHVTGIDAKFMFSSWDGTLDEAELGVAKMLQGQEKK